MMFGFKRKPKRRTMKNVMREELASSIKREMIDDDEPQYYDNSLDNIPLLPNGQINSSIDCKLLSQLPLHYQRYSIWSRIDFEKYFEVPPEEPDEELPKSPDNPLSRVSRESETELDVCKLTEERKTKVYYGLVSDPISKKKALQFELEHLKNQKKTLSQKVIEVESKIKSL